MSSQKSIEGAVIQVTLWGMVVNLILTAIKFIGGFFGNSAVLIADGVHSLSDLITDIMTIIMVRIAAKPPDRDHPHGHGKVETLAALGVAAILCYVGGSIIYEQIKAFFQPEPEILPSNITLWIAGISIAAKEVLYRYTYKIGKLFQSKLVMANAHHHRTDALSSIAALIGLIVVIFSGRFEGEAIAAIIVGGMIVHAAYEIGKESVLELIDTRQFPPEQDAVEALLLKQDGVLGCHDFIIRFSGPFWVVEIDIEVSETLSVKEGHLVADRVKKTIMTELNRVHRVIVHVDPV